MRTIARFMDARNTTEGKFLSVLLSVLLVFSFLNVTMFTDYANAEDETVSEVTVEENQSLDVVDPVTDESETIDDEATPMGAFDEPHCWVHWVMLLGILLTAVYGIVVVRRRLHLADDVDDYEKQVLGIEDEQAETVPATGHQAL